MMKLSGHWLILCCRDIMAQFLPMDKLVQAKHTLWKVLLRIQFVKESFLGLLNIFLTTLLSPVIVNT